MDRHTQITPHFNLSEFIRSQDPMPSNDIILNLFYLANRLQVVRDLLGKPIRINSGYRTLAHNKAVGGAESSLHLKGMAADIVIDGMTPQATQKALSNWSGGMGSADDFTHLDIRPTKARWSY